jgi:hypothetical protein
MSLKLNTASGGSITLQEADTASNLTLTVPAQAGSIVTADSSGNVGIGTTTNLGKLAVQGTITAKASADESILSISHNGSEAVISASYGSTGSYDPMVFKTSDAERMRIDSSGNLLVGQTTDALGTSNSLQVTSTGEVSQLNRNNATDGVILRYKKQGSTVGYISTNTYSLPSDARVKTDIQDIIYGLDFVNALRPVQYNTIFQDQEKLSQKNFGLIAQEVESTLGQFGKSIDDVTFLEKFEQEQEGESQYGLGYQNLVPVLIKAIQELKAVVDAQAERIATLENK